MSVRGLIAACLVTAACAGACAERSEHHDQHGEHGGHDEHHDDGAPAEPIVVRLSERALARAGIATVKVARRTSAGALSVPAEVRLDPDRTAHITPLVASQVSGVRAKLGDRVEKNQALATLRSVELGEARAEVSKARAAVAVAEANHTRQERLADAGVGARKSLIEAAGELKKSRAALAAARSRARVYGGSGGSGSRTTIRSPFAGTIILRHATVGEVAQPERPLFVVADLSSVWVVGRVYESHVGRVRVGQPASVRLEAYPNRRWTGSVSYVSPVLDERTRTAELRVVLDNDGALKPGLFGRILVGAGSDADGGVGDSGPMSLTVPADAVQRMHRREYAFVPGGAKGEFRAVPIATGSRAEGLVEIVSGLVEGDTVVASGAFTLKSIAQSNQLGEGHAH